MRTVALFAGILAAGFSLSACGSGAKPRAAAKSDSSLSREPEAGRAELIVPAGQYAAYFQIAKDVLRDFQFDLDRVDAASGVITTQPRAWAGFMTPWLPFGASAGTTLEGFVQNERRAARVFFVSSDETPDSLDLREATGELTMRIEAQVQHVERPLKRVSIASARLVSHARDPELERSGLQPSYAYLAATDPVLAKALAERVQKHVDKKIFTPQTSQSEAEADAR